MSAPPESDAVAPDPAGDRDLGHDVGSDLERHRFRVWVGLLVAAAAALRLAYVLVAKPDDPVVGDQIYYSAQAVTIANGDWFADPFVPDAFAADHAPLTALLLAPASWSDTDPFLAQRLLMSLYGVVAVVGIAVLARWLFGRRVALWATGIAAVYANFWMNDALLMSETLSTIAVVAVLLAAYRFDLLRDTRSAVVLGIAIGAAGLARAELLAFGPALAVPLAVLGRRDETSSSWRRRVGHVALAAAAATTMVAPWVIRNQIRFEESTTISTQDGLTIAGTNCPEAYGGPGRGFWILDCALRIDVPPGADQSERSAVYRQVGLDYLGDHVDELPGVVAARLGRGLSLWQTEAMTFLNVGEGRETWASRIGLYQYWLLVPLAVVGLVRWRGHQSRWPLLVPVGITLLVIAAFYGIPRFRIPAEVTIVLGAAAALELTSSRLSARWTRAGRRATPTPGSPRTA